MNFEKMNSDQLVTQVNTNNDALAYIEDSKRTFLNGLINGGASNEEVSEATEQLDNTYAPRVNDLRLENEVISKILWERAKDGRS